MVVVLGMSLSSLWSLQQKGVLGYHVSVGTAQLLQSTNTARVADGEGSLVANNALDAAAQAKAQNMVAENYWSHVSPNGTQPWQFISQAGYQYQTAGENLAYGYSSGSAVVSAWMNSAEHRANILDANYKDVGFGIANATNFRGTGPETIVVAMYAQPAAAGASASTLSGAASASAHAAVLGAQSTASVSRIQVLTGGNAPWSLALVAAIAFAAGSIVALRHGLMWRRALARGEMFAVRHHVLDVLLVSVGIAGFILTRSAGGVIH